ncbi:hypothetical protein GWK47_019716 [Chionoecetes opilio]|uniref:Uncharacterized protein n=1 Tax=Chionoecetes opilio TaxID=41210 RepID=A0A8J5BX43_CHIOP|nr:hypothetical protein GWK47_019716 [Chionoecetes opilio]
MLFLGGKKQYRWVVGAVHNAVVATAGTRHCTSCPVSFTRQPPTSHGIPLWRVEELRSQPSQPLDDLSQTQQSVFELQNPSWERKEKARTAHAYLRKALKGLDEPCEWFMLQFLEVEKELHGQDSAIRVLGEIHGEERRAPAHHLAYHFYRTLVPGSTQQQLTQLECIIKESPDDPLVVETVNLYLRTRKFYLFIYYNYYFYIYSPKKDENVSPVSSSLYVLLPYFLSLLLFIDLFFYFQDFTLCFLINPLRPKT